MRVKQGFVLREICGEYIIVPTGEIAIEFNGLMTVNEIGAFLWERLNQEVSFEDLLQAILDEYDVDEVTARIDLKEFIEYLNKYQILEEK